MGLVFQAEDLHLRRRVALKVMRPETQGRPGARERFLREARAAAAVRHEHVITIYHVDQTNDVPFLVMELLEGQSLEKRCQMSPPLSLAEVARIGREVAEGLAAAHDQGLTHRDIKPDNIWLEAPQDKVKVLDFGLARAARGDAQLTQNGLIVGTPAYMAPEQATGGPIDGRTDLFSLGGVLFRLVAGRPPFAGQDALEILHSLANETPPPLSQLNPEVPEAFSQLVVSLLARRPEQRPASAQAVAQALAALESECAAPNAKRPTQRLKPAQRLRSVRHSTLWVLAVLGVCALALAVGAVLLHGKVEQGEIVIQTNDPKVEVLFAQGKVHLLDRTSGKKYSVALGPQQKPSGDYEFEVTDETAGLSFTTNRFTLKRGDSVPVEVSFHKKQLSPRKPPILPSGPVPADALKRQNIPEDFLARAGDGDKAKAPPELVAVLGGLRHFPAIRPFSLQSYTRYSPDGRLLATCAWNDVWVYDVATGGVLWRLAHAQACGWFAFRPDNTVLAVSGFDGITFWDLGTGKSLGVLPEYGNPVRGVTFTCDGASVITCDPDGKARVWEVASKKLVQTFDPPQGFRYTQAPQVHPDGVRVVLHASGVEPVVRILDLRTGKLEVALPGAPGDANKPDDYKATVRFLSSGKLLASVGRKDNSILLWDVATWKKVGEWEGSPYLNYLGADAAGTTLLRANRWNSGNTIYSTLYDVNSRSRKASLELPLAGDSGLSDLSPDGKTVAVRTITGSSVRLFDATTGKEKYPASSHKAAVSEVAVSPDGRWLLSSGHDQRVLLWDLSTGKEVREVAFVKDGWEAFRSAGFSPDGKWMAAQKQQYAHPAWIRLWETATGKEGRTLTSPGKSWWYLEFAFHPNGGSLVGALWNQPIQWNLAEDKPTLWPVVHGKPVPTVTYSSDGQRLASGDLDGLVCVWDGATRKPIERFHCPCAVRRVRFSPDGDLLAATCWLEAGPEFPPNQVFDRALYLWDLKTGVQTRREGHTGNVMGLAWRPDGQMIATASHDGTVRLWPRDPAQPPQVIPLHAGKQEQLTFTPEGRHLITANEDGSIFVLRLAPSEKDKS
jgi:WD40 repeat protein/serine/threonine protein kinase